MKRKSGQASIGTAEAPNVAVPIIEIPTAKPRPALFTPYLDFWLLGGASIAVWTVMALLNPLRPYAPTLDFRFSTIVPIIGLFALIAQYPHFIASYKLAYTQGGKFVLRHWFQLLFVPIVLLVLSGWAFFATGRLPVESFPFKTLNHLFEKLGMGFRIGIMPTTRAEVMGWLMNLVLFTTGWHSAKQAYGCMMVYGSWDKYTLTMPQRSIIRYALLAVWLRHVTFTRTHQSVVNFNDFSFQLIRVPYFTFIISQVLVVVGIVAVIYFVIWQKYKSDKRLPSLNFLVPGLALMIWYLPRFSYAEFAPFVAVFHGIQYMGFIHKVEGSRMASLSAQSKMLKGTAYFIALITIGWLVLEVFPDLADKHLRNRMEMNFLFFSVFAFSFSNIHHYFIDNVIWRFYQRDVKEYLLK